MHVAIEGPCCAGKTTLARNLVAEFGAANVTVVLDYSDFVGGGRNLPTPLPKSWDEEEAALVAFETIEKQRIDQSGGVANGPGLVLIDRSVHTLLAHCFSLSEMERGNFFQQACDFMSRSKAAVWPMAVFYLDTNDDIVKQRNRGKFPEGSIFIDSLFNAGFRNYFLPGLRFQRVPVHCLDAGMDPAGLCSLAGEIIRRDLNFSRKS